ncbi:DUF4112 domain-containing protein [Terriglobus aquaticus]|uniref:DUF4112 domain-containing protein n=1 Tax=Terriglobus aquaticus TaxID=940139 RepID=A0ABW9KGS2_9BACT|nr:DUF4112 domain-containing protein [Terriglobus aquaticus]
MPPTYNARTGEVEPEVIPPRSGRGADLFSDERLDMLSHVLDDFLVIPGTRIRFGLDAIIGLIPGIGDVIGGMASWIIILAAWLRGVPRLTLARMLANVAIETIIGAVPILGDAFDVAWKANRRNFALLQRSLGERATYPPAGAWPRNNSAAHETAASYPPTSSGTPLRLPPTAQQRKRHAASDWLFLGALMLGMFLLLAIPLALLAWIVGHFLAAGMRH